MADQHDDVPLNDLQRLFSRRAHDIADAVGRVLASGHWLNGPQTSAFCEEFSAYVGVRHCLGVANGTDALEIVLRALACSGRPLALEVVTVANAGGYATAACRLAGLVPVYADIEAASQLVSLPSIVSLLGERTMAVVVTHLYGGLVDVSRLRTMMGDAGFAHVPIVEDCAQAHGGRLDKRMAGSFGDVSTFSFYPTKNLGACGDGGAVLTSDTGLFDLCRQLRQYGWSSKYRVEVPMGRNSRLDEVQAAILRRLLPGLDEANARRVAILARYAKAASDGVEVVRAERGTVAHLAVVMCDDRDGLRRHLAARGIASDVHYPVLDCDQPGWSELATRTDGDLAVSRLSVRRIATLPCFPHMIDEEVSRVAEALAAWRA